MRIDTLLEVDYSPRCIPGSQISSTTMVSVTDDNRVVRYRLTVTGQVQGVGFRPFVYALAVKCELAGTVANDSSGAVIEVEGPASAVERFSSQLSECHPPLARIDEIEQTITEPIGQHRFQIVASTRNGPPEADVTVDSMVCDDCLTEMLDPTNRRYRYPFINCTNCGPRYSIVTSIPYDRVNTTMSGFDMCDRCRSEYQDPADRRFHAQPIACADCGPRLTLVDRAGRVIDGDPIERACDSLRGGQIVAIKGIGGFHLAVDCCDGQAVDRLRRLKRRDHKAFAVMVRDIETVGRICVLDDHSKALLEDIARPIVILPRRPGSEVAEQVAPGMDTLGVFLPYAPHHYLLFEQGAGPLVMTSGNLSDEPLARDNDEALVRLGQIADAFLMHDRPIYRRVDDSVVQARTDGLMMIRRARGFVPQSVDLGCRVSQPILAVGAELKNTVAIAKDSRVVVSEHIGDLKDATVFDHFVQAIDHLCQLFEHRPRVIASDMHPDYMSSQYAAERTEAQLVQVQHHHAHIVSCMVENGLDGPVIGVSCDGAGFGVDGAVWGCELMTADRAEFSRVGHLKYFALPGGDAAAKQTFRPAMGLLYELFGRDVVDLPAARAACPSRQIRRTVVQMIERGVNCPKTSSLGRLFDAVAAMTRLIGVNHYEGQAPMLLERQATDGGDDCYEYALDQIDDMLIIDPAEMIRGLAGDVEGAVSVQRIAGKFHNTVAAFLAAAAEKVAGKYDIDRVVLSGGCFANRRLSRRVRERLVGCGLQCFEHRLIPCNDAGISLGQAGCAAAMLGRELDDGQNLLR